MLGAARNINDHALMEFDLRVIQGHAALSTEDVVELICPLVIVQLGIGNLQVMHLGGGMMVLLDQRPDQAAGLSPRLHVGQFASDVLCGWVHRMLAKVLCATPPSP